ncbi:hypothetical protein M0R45_034963 [Rubus argutus]|uniref:F-box domain-containing protein n=1 Tax=Rubus argutus TaxID=59490 RepID=A0AAW1VVG1_RUBAR
MAVGGDFHKRALTSVADHEGILDEILARLPVKSLMRFRCVCKSWRALISQPYFATKHFNYAGRGITENCSRLLMSTSPFESIDYEALKDLSDGDAHLAIKKLDFQVMFPDSSVKTTVGSCNGLICLEIDQEDVVLWNPCTRDYKVLPKPTIRCTSQFYGFGYDSSTDIYKIMRGYSYRVLDYEETGVQVFSLKTGSWRTHLDPNYFDLAWRGVEKFQEMLPLPYHACFSYIFSLGDCLGVYISGFLDSKLTGFRIWMMKEYGVKDSWTEVVSSENLPEEYEYSLLTPLCILENGEVLMKMDEAIYRETLVSPETSSVADI